MLNTINPQNLEFSQAQWAALIPYLIMSAGTLVTMLLATLEISKQTKSVLLIATVAFLSATLIWTATHWVRDSVTMFGGMLNADYFSSFFQVLLSSSAILVLLGSYSYLSESKIHYGEFYPMIMAATLGMMLMAAAGELLTIFVSLELMSLTVYVMVGMRRKNAFSNEASIKYFVLGGVSGAIYLYGMALIYGATSTTKLSAISTLLQQQSGLMSNPLFVAGLVLLVVAFMFKIAAAPFHAWAPDVYEGAPSNITSYMSTALKAAVFAALVRISITFMGNKGSILTGELSHITHTVLWGLAFLTMIMGNFSALMQSNLKRMMAYSAIAHTGYLMVGILAGPQVGYAGIVFYLVAYTAMNIGAFTLFALIAGPNDEGLTLKNITGLAKRHPMVAGALTVFLLSLGGFPPTVGFAGKYYLFTGALEAGEILLVLFAVITSAVSVFYYLRVVVLMYMKDGEASEVGFSPSSLAYIAIGICVILTIGYGMFPGQLMNAVQRAANF